MAEKQDIIHRLLVADNHYLLKKYASFHFDMKDLVEVIGYDRKDIYYVIYNQFSDYVTLRDQNKLKMLHTIERQINLAIPIEVIQESSIMLKNITQINTLRRAITRLIDRGDLNPEILPITLGRFHILYKRLILRDAIVSNNKSPNPLTLKKLAEVNQVSFSLMAKINRSLDEIPPHIISDEYASVYLKIEFLNQIKQQLESGFSVKQVADEYQIEANDALLIQKTFHLIDDSRWQNGK